MKQLLVLLLFIATPVQAEIYTWTDSRGTAHYTNSLYEVPARYQKRVKILNLDMGPANAPSPQPQGAPGTPGTPAEPNNAAAAPPAPSLPMTTLRPEQSRHRSAPLRGVRRARPRAPREE